MFVCFSHLIQTQNKNKSAQVCQSRQTLGVIVSLHVRVLVHAQIACGTHSRCFSIYIIVHELGWLGDCSATVCRMAQFVCLFFLDPQKLQ